jgi:HSP20 family molecular chaperone IbpA
MPYRRSRASADANPTYQPKASNLNGLSVSAARRVLEALTRTYHIHRACRSITAGRQGAERAFVKVAYEGFESMSRVPSLSSPFLLGFDEIERALDRVSKATDGYPPYNIERIAREASHPERLRITLAVAGFTRDQLDVTVEENQLVIRGRQQEEKPRNFLHRGIAARQFQRCFVLADGMEVLSADLKNGLLSIDLARPHPERIVKTIAISDTDND